jgi:hypothetical protein
MKSSISTKIKQRTTPNDVFITPPKLAKVGISMIDCKESDIWFDPFKNDGSYYNQFPENFPKKWCEILEGKDFFDFDEPIDIISSNPPYSMIDEVLSKSVELKPRVIQYLLGINNLTPKRLEFMENNNYGLTKIHLCKVFKWYGMSCIFQFEKGQKSIITYDRIVWK